MYLSLSIYVYIWMFETPSVFGPSVGIGPAPLRLGLSNKKSCNDLRCSLSALSSLKFELLAADDLSGLDRFNTPEATPQKRQHNL